jgi:hypothetical protein
MTGIVRVVKADVRSAPRHSPLLFCTWLDGARELGAIGAAGLDEAQRAAVLARLELVVDAVDDSDPHGRLVRDLRGAARLGCSWWEAEQLAALLGQLRASFSGGAAVG